ncbi:MULTISPECIES: hypothetical protein [unclassified Endozoicomonas]|uniref:hypothetical protein n=1 Tax=unclassified Endozoicomonas TaxID=2644528 RepID=UPI003BB4CC30
MAEVNRLESCVRHSISDWLEDNSPRYNFSHFSRLKRQLLQTIDLETPQEQLGDIIETVITQWREKYETPYHFDDWDKLSADLFDRIDARQQQIKRDERLRHAS